MSVGGYTTASDPAARIIRLTVGDPTIFARPSIPLRGPLAGWLIPSA
jgi:hypothetical protein